MKINKNHNKKRTFIISSLAGLLLVALTAAAVFIILPTLNNAQINPATDTTVQEEPKINLDAPSKEQIDIGQQNKEDSLNNNSPPATESLGVTITALIQNSSSSTLQIRTLIQTVTGSGACTLKLQKGSVVVSRTADIQAGPSNSTCKGFDVPLSELSTGTWAVLVEVVSGSSTGKATSQVDIDAN